MSGRRGARGRAGDSAGSARAGRGRRTSGGAAEGGSERWLVTYADVLTLLLVLFIVLFSISVVNTGKYQSLKTSLSSAFGDGAPSVLDGGNGLKDNNADSEGMQLVMPGVNGAPTSSSAPQAPVPAAGTTKPRYSAAVEKEVRDFNAIKRAIHAALARRGIGNA